MGKGGSLVLWLNISDIRSDRRRDMLTNVIERVPIRPLSTVGRKGMSRKGGTGRDEIDETHIGLDD